MVRVLAIGECMVELAPAGAGLFGLGFAGDTFNTAWYLRHLLPARDSVAYLTAVGDEALSQQMVGFMAGEGIDIAHVARVAGREVGLYLIQLSGGERSFSYWRSQSAARLLAEEVGRLRTAMAGVDLIYLSGITLAILTPEARHRLMGAVAEARAEGARLAFDPNIRPALWPDADVMRAVLSDAAARADIVLPSFDDEALHFGDAHPEATARRYGAAGDALVVVKDGALPVVTWQGGAVRAHAVAPPILPVVDTTAAGDSFNAGFLAAHLAGQPLAAAVAAGAALAGRVIGGRGALVRAAIEAPGA